MLSIIRKLFDKRNLLAIGTVLIGILGIFDIPQSLGVPTDKLILGLLSFIALEAIIVNIGYIEDIQNDVKKLDEKISKPNIDKMLSTELNRLDFSKVSEDATDILICGISLTNFIMSQATKIRQLASKGCRLRFVFTDANVPFLGHWDVNTPNHISEEIAKSEILTGMARLSQLYQSLSETQRKYITARSCSGIPHYSSLKISTKTKAANIIWVSFYSYGQSQGNRRNLLLTQTTSPDTFEFYNNSVEDIWNASTAIDLTKSTG